MKDVYKIQPLIVTGADRVAARQYLADTAFFDESIMHYQDEALRVWRSVAHRYSNKEAECDIPYSLAESPKLYALDALCFASPLVKDPQQLFTLAELFTVFYLMTHFFDDHVEHPDKFFSKFDFSKQSSLNTQYGAAPFSFLLLSFSIIKDILNGEPSLSDKARMTLQGAMYDRLVVQTRYFASERESNLNVEEVLEMKARRVNGQTLGVLADILREFLHYDDAQFEEMQAGLLYLGAMEQVTDDIRDMSVDVALRNANIIVSAYKFGVEAGAKKVEKVYQAEAARAEKHLANFYSKPELAAIFSLPFYPFMVDKQQLEQATGDMS